MWNGLFTLLFKSFTERVIASDSASRLFCTIIYGLFSGVNLDYGTIHWSKLIQSILSTSKHSKTSCARIWSFNVKHAIDCLQIQLKDDSVLVVIPILHTSNIVMFDPTKFSFIRSILEATLPNVDVDNLIVNEYHKKPTSNVHVYNLCWCLSITSFSSTVHSIVY